MRSASALSESSGHTVVELVVAIVILAVGLLALSATAGVVSRMMTVSLAEAQARFAARARLEELLAQPSDRLASGAWRREGLSVRWNVGDGDPRRIVLVVHHALGPHQTGDSLVTLARSR
jgi:type II secretory pathway component PulJ